MSEQHSPDTVVWKRNHYYVGRFEEEAKHRKARRDRQPHPMAENYGKGDFIMVEFKETGGFVVYAAAHVEDVIEFKPLHSWRNEFNLVARICLVTEDKYRPCEGHLFTIDTNMRDNFYFNRTWRLSQRTLEEYEEMMKRRRT